MRKDVRVWNADSLQMFACLDGGSFRTADVGLELNFEVHHFEERPRNLSYRFPQLEMISSGP